MLQIILLQAASSCIPLFGGITFIVFLFLIGAVGFIIGQIRKVAIIVTALLTFWMGSTALSALRGNQALTLCSLNLSSPTMENIVLGVMIFGFALQIIGIVMGVLEKRKNISPE